MAQLLSMPSTHLLVWPLPHHLVLHGSSTPGNLPFPKHVPLLAALLHVVNSKSCLSHFQCPEWQEHITELPLIMLNVTSSCESALVCHSNPEPSQAEGPCVYLLRVNEQAGLPTLANTVLRGAWGCQSPSPLPLHFNTIFHLDSKAAHTAF